MNQILNETERKTMTCPVKLGFLGLGWIGRHRMKAILETGVAQAVCLVEPNPEMVAEAQALAPDLQQVADLNAMLAMDVDGIVIATPSALHAEQSIQALNAGKAVFCQKPLGRTAAEVLNVIEAARSADRLLAVDLSYRFTKALSEIRSCIQNQDLGEVFAVDLVFHNAYGPDKPWFYEKALSGGGCVMDLGVHLVDAALWSLGFPRVLNVSSNLLSGGLRVSGESDKIEDYAVATLELENGAVIRLACSWRLPAGQDAVISADFYGTQGGASMRNINGSFYDFQADLMRGTTRESLVSPPDEWGGRAAADWARKLQQGCRFDSEAVRLADVAEVLDRVYGRSHL